MKLALLSLLFAFASPAHADELPIIRIPLASQVGVFDIYQIAEVAPTRICDDLFYGLMPANGDLAVAVVGLKNTYLVPARLLSHVTKISPLGNRGNMVQLNAGEDITIHFEAAALCKQIHYGADITYAVKSALKAILSESMLLKPVN